MRKLVLLFFVLTMSIASSVGQVTTPSIVANVTTLSHTGNGVVS